MGLHTFDILSQRGLGHIRDGVERVNKSRGLISNSRYAPVACHRTSSAAAMAASTVTGP